MGNQLSNALYCVLTILRGEIPYQGMTFTPNLMAERGQFPEAYGTRSYDQYPKLSLLIP